MLTDSELTQVCKWIRAVKHWNTETGAGNGDYKQFCYGIKKYYNTSKHPYIGHINRNSITSWAYYWIQAALNKTAHPEDQAQVAEFFLKSLNLE